MIARVLLILSFIAACAVCAAQTEAEKLMSQIDFEQRLDSQIPLTATFRDENGVQVTLGQFFGERPVVLVMGYYECPMLCSIVHQEIIEALNLIDPKPGVDYELVSISIDASEQPETARLQRNTYAKRFTRGDATAGFHFLTGDQPEIDKVCESIGFHYIYDPATKQYAHAGGFIVATPSGRVHRYFYGVEYDAGELKTALFNASLEKRGNSVREIILRCFHYDPVTGRFGSTIINSLRVASVLTLVGMAFLMFRRPKPRVVNSELREANE